MSPFISIQGQHCVACFIISRYKADDYLGTQTHHDVASSGRMKEINVFSPGSISIFRDSLTESSCNANGYSDSVLISYPSFEKDVIKILVL
jgi:hypothetical protein